MVAAEFIDAGQTVVRLGQIGVQLERRLLLSDGLLEPSLLEVDIAEVAQGLWIARVQAQGSVHLGDRIARFPLPAELAGFPQVLLRLPQREGGGVGASEIVFSIALAETTIGVHEHWVNGSEPRVALTRALEAGDGLAVVPDWGEGQPKVIEHAGRRVNLDEPLVVVDRSRDVALLPMRHGEALRRIDDGAVAPNALERLDGLVIRAGLQPGEAEEQIARARSGLVDVASDLGLDCGSPVGELRQETVDPPPRGYIAVFIAVDDRRQGRRAPHLNPPDAAPCHHAPRGGAQPIGPRPFPPRAGHYCRIAPR